MWTGTVEWAMLYVEKLGGIGHLDTKPLPKCYYSRLLCLSLLYICGTEQCGCMQVLVIQKGYAIVSLPFAYFTSFRSAP